MKKLMLVALLGACAAGSTQARQEERPDASEGAPLPLPDVLVTAERTEAPSRRSPVSLGVLTTQDLQLKGVTQLSDLAGLVAGVTVPSGFSNTPQAVGIRGVGVSQPASSQAVGLYVDDVPLVRGYATALWDLPDLVRVEVLRGPQGTLYGQNSSAGAVKYVSALPEGPLAAWVLAGLGSQGARELRGLVQGQLADSPFSASLAFSRRSNDGFGYNATRHERINKLDVLQFRTKLRWAMSPATEAVLALDGLLDRSDTNTVNYPRHVPQAAPRVSFTAGPDGDFRREAGGLSLHLTHLATPGLTLRSITALRHYRDDPAVADFGGLPVQRYGVRQRDGQNTFSQELQMQGHDETVAWTGGALLVSDRFDFDRVTLSYPLAAPAASYAQALTHLSTVDLGVYGQARVAVTPYTRLTTGLRLYRTRQSGSNANWATDADERRLKTVYLAEHLSTASSGLLPRLGVDHQLTRDQLLYASVARGEKFGGFNRAAGSELSARYPTRPETVTAYEVGSKALLAAGRLSANVAVFYNDYRDYLASLSNLVINGVLVPDAVLANAARAKTYGMDLDLSARLTPRTDWTLTLEWLRSRFDRFANPAGTAAADNVGHELPHAPRWSGSTSIRQHWSHPDGDTLVADLGVRITTGRYTDPANSRAVSIPSETYVDASAVYSTAGGRWSVSLQVRNLMNRTYALLPYVIPPLGVDTAYYNPPRTWTASARWQF